MRRQKLIGATNDQQVDVVDWRGVYLDQHLAGTGKRRDDLGDAKLLRFTEFADDDRAHP